MSEERSSLETLEEHVDRLLKEKKERLDFLFQEYVTGRDWSEATDLLVRAAFDEGYRLGRIDECAQWQDSDPGFEEEVNR